MRDFGLIMKKTIFLSAIPFLTGCGTLTTLNEPCPYIGTKFDYNMVIGNFYDGVGFVHMSRPFFLIDWPISVVADTALLPINIPRYYLSDEKIRAECEKYGDPYNRYPWLKNRNDELKLNN